MHIEEGAPMHGPGVLLLQDKEEKMTIDVHMLHIRSRALWTLAKQTRTGTGRPAWRWRGGGGNQ